MVTIVVNTGFERHHVQRLNMEYLRTSTQDDILVARELGLFEENLHAFLLAQAEICDDLDVDLGVAGLFVNRVPEVTIAMAARKPSLLPPDL